jgi:hypothetical protein
MTAAVLTKAVDWACEEEFRLVDVDMREGAVAFDPRLLTDVILGARMEDADRRSILRMVAIGEPRVSVSTAEINEREFRIDLKRLTDGERSKLT